MGVTKLKVTPNETEKDNLIILQSYLELMAKKVQMLSSHLCFQSTASVLVLLNFAQVKVLASHFSFQLQPATFFPNSVIPSPVNERNLLCTCLINCTCTSGGKPTPSHDPPFPCSANSSGGMLGSFFLDLRVVESLTDVMIKSLL